MVELRYIMDAMGCECTDAELGEIINDIQPGSDHVRAMDLGGFHKGNFKCSKLSRHHASLVWHQRPLFLRFLIRSQTHGI